MSVRMRDNTDAHAKCTACNNPKPKALFDIGFGVKEVTICEDCGRTLLQKLCKANTEFNAKLKVRE